MNLIDQGRLNIGNRHIFQGLIIFKTVNLSNLLLKYNIWIKYVCFTNDAMLSFW